MGLGLLTQRTRSVGGEKRLLGLIVFFKINKNISKPTKRRAKNREATISDDSNLPNNNLLVTYQ